jgi:F0F1-type ATP synthase delta subunit
MNYTDKQYASAFYLALKDNPAKQDLIISNFSRLLVKNNARALLVKIIRSFNRLRQKNDNFHSVVLTTAKKAGPDLIARVKKSLGENIIIQEEVNPNVLGGVRLVIDDEQIIDATFERKINILARHLLNSEIK